MDLETYYLCLLRKGPAWTPDQTPELERLQAEHVAHNLRLMDSGAKLVAGPVDDGSDIRGISIFRTASRDEARALAEADPAVRAGRLIVELHEWKVPAGRLAVPAPNKIAPWLSVADAARAVDYYEAAFGAVELYRLEDEAGSVQIAHLAIGGADVWLQQDADTDPHALGDRSPVRMILTVDDPDTAFTRAIVAGGSVIAPVHEEEGWRIGRLADPAGHQWEIGKPLTP